MERGDIEVEYIFGAWRSCKFRETELSALSPSLTLRRMPLLSGARKPQCHQTDSSLQTKEMERLYVILENFSE